MDLETQSPMPRTRWGDRVGRRRDILRAAAEVLERDGYGGFQVRAVAKLAGVSSASLYSYFDTKEDLFAAVQIQRFQEFSARLDQLGPQETTSLERLFTGLMPELVSFYRHFGQHVGSWMQASDPSPMIRSLVYAFRDATSALGRAVRRAAHSEGLHVPEDDALLVPRLWATLFGTAQLHVTALHDILGYAADDLTESVARSLALEVERAASTTATSPKHTSDPDGSKARSPG